MGNYKVTLDSIIIRTTRARHEDTVFATFSLGGRAGQTKALGNLNNGTHLIGLTDTVTADDAASLSWQFAVTNKGNNPDQAQEAQTIGKKLIDWAKQLAVGSNVWTEIVALGATALGQAINVVFPDCDGPCAVDTQSVSISTIAPLMPDGNAYVWSKRYNPGPESPVGCGKSSDYEVHVTIKKLS